MQGRAPNEGIFSPEELTEIEAELARGSVPGESPLDREDRAIRLMEARKRKAKDLPDDLRAKG